MLKIVIYFLELDEAEEKLAKTRKGMILLTFFFFLLNGRHYYIMTLLSFFWFFNKKKTKKRLKITDMQNSLSHNDKVQMWNPVASFWLFSP